MNGIDIALTRDDLRRVFGLFPSGVVAVCARVEGIEVGFAVSTFIPVSINPPMVGFCVQNSSTTWPKLDRVTNLGISLLGDEHGEIALRLSAKSGNRFENTKIESTDGGAVFVPGAGVWIDATVVQQVPAGDHAMVLLDINSIRLTGDLSPMIFHRSEFRRLHTDNIRLKQSST